MAPTSLSSLSMGTAENGPGTSSVKRRTAADPWCKLALLECRRSELVASCLRRLEASSRPRPNYRLFASRISVCGGRRAGRQRGKHRLLLRNSTAKFGLADANCVRQHGIETSSSSPGELEMTCNTSEVAVCCSSDSDSSRVRACTSSNNRTFR